MLQGSARAWGPESSWHACPAMPAQVSPNTSPGTRRRCGGCAIDERKEGDVFGRVRLSKHIANAAVRSVQADLDLQAIRGCGGGGPLSCRDGSQNCCAQVGGQRGVHRGFEACRERMDGLRRCYCRGACGGLGHRGGTPPTRRRLPPRRRRRVGQSSDCRERRAIGWAGWALETFRRQRRFYGTSSVGVSSTLKGMGCACLHLPLSVRLAKATLFSCMRSLGSSAWHYKSLPPCLSTTVTRSAPMPSMSWSTSPRGQEDRGCIKGSIPVVLGE